jgi:hypothetical protein
VIRERNGNSLPAVFRSEGAALSFIKARVAKAPWFTPTKPAHGTTFTAYTK